MSERTAPKDVDAEAREQMMRWARWHLAEMHRHRLAAWELADSIAALRRDGGGGEQDVMEEIAGIVAELEVEVEAEAAPEMEEDPEWGEEEEKSYDPTYHNYGPGAAAWLKRDEAELVPPHERGGRKHAARTVDKWAPLVARYRELRTQGKGITEARYTAKAEWEQLAKGKPDSESLSDISVMSG